jgi:hypothetical protein
MNNQLSKKIVTKVCVNICVVFALVCPKTFAGPLSGSTGSPDYIGTKLTETKPENSAKTHTTPVILTLEKIEVVRTAENLSGDQVYVNITEYSSIDKPTMHRIPEYPSHWLSKYIDKVKNVPLWNKPIKDAESVELIISVVESDAPPWDVDDLIGSVKLKVYIEKGKLEQEWSIPNNAIVKKEGEMGHFVLTGDGAEYKISLKLALEKNSDKDKKDKKNKLHKK